MHKSLQIKPKFHPGLRSLGHAQRRNTSPRPWPPAIAGWANLSNPSLHCPKDHPAALGGSAIVGAPGATGAAAVGTGVFPRNCCCCFSKAFAKAATGLKFDCGLAFCWNILPTASSPLRNMLEKSFMAELAASGRSLAGSSPAIDFSFCRASPIAARTLLTLPPTSRSPLLSILEKLPTAETKFPAAACAFWFTNFCTSLLVASEGLSKPNALSKALMSSGSDCCTVLATPWPRAAVPRLSRPICVPNCALAAWRPPPRS
mmetsp:Transcript_908/g.2108  ORF Transcript_908/g.2108 Transcript_908/m.2108 type:complete len:260 (-) Transcript_908:891-1670(-)